MLNTEPSYKKFHLFLNTMDNTPVIMNEESREFMIKGFNELGYPLLLVESSDQVTDLQLSKALYAKQSPFNSELY